MATKKEWERVVDYQVNARLKEAYKLIGKAIKQPDPAISKLVSHQMQEVTAKLLMKGGAKHVSEKDYDFDIDDEGDPVFGPKGALPRDQIPKVGGYA